MGGRGVSVALMGIDGAGKTSLLRYLGQALAEIGVESVDASKKPAIGAARLAGGFPARSLERLWLESWRLVLGGGHAGEVSVDTVIPLQFTDETRVASGWIVDALPAEVVGVRRSGPVASALNELTLDQVIQAEITGPALERGAVAFVDGFGFKPAIKNICIAREITDDSMSDDALDQFESIIHTAYSFPAAGHRLPARRGSGAVLRVADAAGRPAGHGGGPVVGRPDGADRVPGVADRAGRETARGRRRLGMARPRDRRPAPAGNRRPGHGHYAARPADPAVGGAAGQCGLNSNNAGFLFGYVLSHR
jgi:hypothetical protein